jgi:hypothetical protein
MPILEPSAAVVSAQSKAARPQQPEPSSALFFVVVVCAAANAEWSTRVGWSATDTVEDFRRRSERALGKRRSNYLLVETTRKPMRDQLLVMDYGLNGLQRLRLVTDVDGRLRGGASDIDALLALRNALTGPDKLNGGADLPTPRDPSKCKGVQVEGGRVARLDVCDSRLSGEYSVNCLRPAVDIPPARTTRTRRDFTA